MLPWNRWKRWAALAGAMALLASLAGCSTLPKSYYENSSEESSEPAESSGPSVEEPAQRALTLCYSSGDTLNPFTAATRSNLSLASLLYQGLTALDDGWVPQPSLASSVSVSAGSVTAVLREDAVFSDGSPVTAADAAASYRAAKSSSNYAALLENVTGVSADKDGRTLTFSLSSPDPNAAACLSFPVIKEGTESNPVGSGPYVFTKEGSAALTANPHYSGPLANETIQLKDYPEGDTTIRALESGTISFYFDDLSSGDIPRTSSANISVPLNSLVFLGVNSRRAPLSDAAVRQAVSAAVSRSELAANAFAGRAQPAVSPFSAQWEPAVELTGFDANENIAVAVAQLEQAGYNNTDEDSSNGKSLSLELLVSDSNSFRTAAAELLVQQLSKAGITVEVAAVPFAEYEERLADGEIDLYLGEIRLSAHMSLRPLFSSGGAASYGVNTGGAAAAAYTEYRNGQKTLAEFVQAFADDLPYIPLCWRDGLAAYDRSLSGVTPTAFDSYYGIGSWSFS